MNPSCAVTKLTEWRGRRPLHWYRSALPHIRLASAPVRPGSPFQKRRTSSRYWPFHSLHRRPNGKCPTWYSPPASHGSAISLVSASTPSSVMLSTTGGSTITFPFRSRPRMDARSNRNPSTCMSPTQYRRHVMIRSRTTGWLQFTVLPHPE